MKQLKITLFFFFILFSDVPAFVETLSPGGEALTWASHARNVQFNISTSNNSGISADDVEDIINYSLNQWNGRGDIILSGIVTNTVDRNENNIYFSSDSQYFGAGVLAITLVAYYIPGGEIASADIIINDTVNYTADADSTVPSGSSFYLGDILSHEVGHSIGVGHGQVHGSTMTFTAFKGQHTIHSDEIEGANQKYPDQRKGAIQGTVAGSDNRIGIFGAHVQAISATTGEVTLSAITAPDGSFSLNSLPVDDTYYLYVSPIKGQTNLPQYFSTVANNFCNGNNSWQGNFFSKCGDQGHPQGFHFSTPGQTINVGTITASCSFMGPAGYTSASGTNSHNIVQAGGDVGEAITGFFLESTINANSTLAILNDPAVRNSDSYIIDLSAYDPDDTRDTYLDIKVVSQGIYSPLRTNVLVNRTDNDPNFSAQMPISFNTVNNVSAPDHAGVSKLTGYDLDHVLHIPLDEVTPTNNIFEIEIIPQPLTQGGGLVAEDFFPSNSVISDSRHVYMMILTISELNSGQYSVIEEKIYSPYGDNAVCMDAPNAYLVQANTDGSASSARGEDDSPATCGQISSNGPGTGGGNFIIILFITLIIFLREQKMANSLL